MRLASRLRSYSFASAICIVATIMSWISGAPSSCFHLAIVICSLYGENGAGLLSLGLSIVSFEYFFLSPRFQFAIESSSYPRLAAFVATAVCVNLVIAAKQRGDRAHREALEDRKATLESLQKMEQRLARAAQIATLGEVSASIAHEINQPLTAIIANAHMCFDSLAGDAPPIEDARLLVQDILECGYHATDVVRRMRTLFKSGTLERAPLDINEVVKEVLSLIRSEAGKRRVNLEIDLETGLPPILADRVQIQQVLMNLCINGLDAMESVADRRRTLSLRTRSYDPGAIGWKYRIAVSVCGSPTESSRHSLPPSKTEWAWDFPSAAPSSSYITAFSGRKTAILLEPRFASHSRCLITLPRNLTVMRDSGKDGSRQRRRSQSNLRHSFFVSSFLRIGMSRSSNAAL